MDKKSNTKLNPGDTVCPQCKGSGKGKKWESGQFTVTPECSKCLGDGKFDWIEVIMGKPNRFYMSTEAWTNEAAKSLADEIDKEILENILDACKEEKEHNIK